MDHNLEEIDVFEEENIYDFDNRARDANMKYINNNNKNYNNGIVIMNKRGNSENQRSLIYERPNDTIEEEKVTFKNVLLSTQNILNENAICEVVNLGYTREYLLRSFKNNDFNYATTTYNILNNLS